MLATEKVEYKDKTTVNAGVDVDDEGYVTMGTSTEMDLNFDTFGPSMPGSSNDMPVPKGAGKGVSMH